MLGYGVELVAVTGETAVIGQGVGNVLDAYVFRLHVSEEERLASVSLEPSSVSRVSFLVCHWLLFVCCCHVVFGYRAFDPAQTFNDHNYSLFHTGRPLWIDDGIVNLSMLRIVGATEGAKFMIDAVISRPELDRISTGLVKAAESFYADYIQTVDIGICVSVRDLTLDSQV